MKNGNNNRNQALWAFTFTLLAILAVGIPSLFALKSLKEGKQTDSLNFEVEKHWEQIPENISKIVEDRPDTFELTEPESQEIVENFAIIPEDAEYTRFVNTSQEGCVTVSFTGDILFDDNYAVGESFRKNGNSVEGVIGQSLLQRMRNSDIMVVNNEFPYSNGGAPIEGKTYTFRARPEKASMLKEMGADLASLANNHAYDYGEQALLDSFEAIKSVGVTYAGAGYNIEEASHPIYYVTQNGIKLAIICATQIERMNNPDTKGATESSPGVFRCLDDSLLIKRITEAKSKGAFVIVFIHWGTESTTEIDYLQTDQAKDIAAAGAGLIIGSHPHVLQKIGYVQGIPVVYSLGNFIFTSRTLDTGMITVKISGNGIESLEFVPAIQESCTVHEATDSERERIISKMDAMSPDVSIDGNGMVLRK